MYLSSQNQASVSVENPATILPLFGAEV